jgi:SHAQKYF class myb-like DNA-binding protein
MEVAHSVPPRVVIAATKAPFTSSSSRYSKADGAVSPKGSKSSEKIGRWTEEEHMVFLDGLEKHGKQWKTIAGMIGTRTVVQVRTHAQKYFQKMDRKQKPTTPVPPVANVLSPKRKSLPASLPSRKKAKLSASPKKPRISISLGAINSSPSHAEMPNFSSVSSLENLSTVSPSGVNEFDMDSFHKGLDYGDFDAVGYSGEDPLEWLIDNESNIQHLPESSLSVPLFPDFSDLADGGGVIHLQPQLQCNVIPDVTDNLPYSDPKVTVQSLFMDEIEP